MTVFLDLDGVIANFCDAACCVHNVTSPYMNPKNHGIWDMYSLMGMPAHVVESKFDFKFWLGLEKMDDAKLILAFAKKLGPVYFLSAPVKTRGCRDGKHAWVSKHYPEHELIMCSAKAKRAMAHSRSWLIDDRDSNVEEFRENGGNAVLVPRPWNSLHSQGWNVASMMRALKIQVKMTKRGEL